MDDRTFLNASQLSVSIEGAEFAKEFNYFITVLLDGQSEKRRTDISARVTNPVFSSNTFHLPLPSNKIELNMRLHFAAFVVTDRENSTQQSKGQSRLLGESVLQLGPLTSTLLDPQGAGSRQHLKFTRSHEGQLATVGRFLVNLKLIVEREEPSMQKDADSIFHPMPAADPYTDFVWRARIDMRAAIDIPLNQVTSIGLPSCCMEAGWSQYLQQMPAEQDRVRTKIIQNNRHPIWNQQILYNNPPHLSALDGFMWVTMRDANINNLMESLSVPLQSAKPYHPVHLALRGSKIDETGQVSQIFLSFVIEEAVTSSFVDHLVDIAITGLNWNPVPQSISKLMIGMTTHSHHLTEQSSHRLPFLDISLQNEGSVSRELSRHKSEKHSTFLTPVLSVIPIRTDNPYGAQAVFTIPRSYLEKQLSFFIIVRDDNRAGEHPLPNSIIGYTEVLDDHLQNSLQQSSISARDNKDVYAPVIWDPRNLLSRDVGQSKCNLQLSVHSLEVRVIQKMEENSLNRTHIEERPARREPHMSLRGSMNLEASLPEVRERWDLLSRELQQKQELIHRLMKQNDEKSDALKLTGTEIIELRRHIKLLQSENAILKQRLNEEAEIDIKAVVSQEVERMNNDELKLKIIKLAHMYRTERQRNEEFEKVIKQTQDDLSDAQRQKIELDRIREKHVADLQKFHKIQSQVDRIQTYRETIKKQEAVIGKLETLLQKNLKDAQQSRQAATEMAKLKSENLALQSQIKKGAFGNAENYTSDHLKQENERLEQLVRELRAELENRRPGSGGGFDDDMEDEKIRLELELEKANIRVQEMQNEMERSAIQSAQEIQHLKNELAEKRSIIEIMAADVK